MPNTSGRLSAPQPSTPELCLNDAAAILPAHLRTKRRYRTQEASLYLLEVHGIKIAGATLEVKRCRGGGPAFNKLSNGGVLYPRDSLDTWAHQQLGEPVHSTSEADNRKEDK